MQPLWVNEDKLLSAEDDYFTYEFYINLMETAKQKSREEIWNIKKSGGSENNHGNPPNYKSRQKQKEKEIGYKISRVQKVKW